MLTAEERSRVETRLQEERERALGALREFEEERSTSLLDDTGELSLYRFHMADIGTEAMEQEKQMLLASVEGRRLFEIDEALRRLYSSPETFGACERCGSSIPLERLDVVPEARFCVTCQSEVEE
jgi:DnaK suppressor protein